MTRFREVQRFELGYAKAALAMPPAILAGLSVWQIGFHRSWGGPPMSDAGLLFLTALTGLVYLRLITMRLVTELSANELSVSMKGMWRRVRVPIAEIKTARVVEFDPGEYGGYGVREGPQGRAFVASGRSAVQVELRDGGKLLVGSHRAEELALAINASRIT